MVALTLRGVEKGSQGRNVRSANQAQSGARSVTIASHRPIQRRHWERAIALIRIGGLEITELPHALDMAGLGWIGDRLRTPGLLDYATELLLEKRVCTALCPQYPARWIRKLGESAPGALWWNGVNWRPDHVECDIPLQPHACVIAVVGSREPSGQSATLALSIGKILRASGYAFCSGGAPGVDTLAAHGFLASSLRDSATIHTHREGECPHEGIGLDVRTNPEDRRGVGWLGLGTGTPHQHPDGRCPVPAADVQTNACESAFQGFHVTPFLGWSCRVDHAMGSGSARDHAQPNSMMCEFSCNPPWATFGTAAAMERNQLIYAAADAAVLIQPRYRQGGTWHGAISAHRLRLCQLIVPDDSGCLASRTLIALGGTPLQVIPKGSAVLEEDSIREALSLSLSAAHLSRMPQHVLAL